jgi:hypothetical protein
MNQLSLQDTEHIPKVTRMGQLVLLNRKTGCFQGDGDLCTRSPCITPQTEQMCVWRTGRIPQFRSDVGIDARTMEANMRADNSSRR